VVRRRLFQDLGNEKVRRNVAKAFADWCFERRAQLPPEWTAVDSAATEAKAREFLQRRFEACYPFHPATLSVFQRKWQALAQYQQTRGTLAMLAQWISIAAPEAFRKARTEPLITLGSAPLAEPGFRSIVLGQLGESRLVAAIDTDIAGEQAHSKALDADTKGPLRGIHQRVATATLFESSGGQSDKVAHLPELRFALGEPQVDTTSIDNAAFALEDRAYFIRRVGSDGFRIGYQPTMKKVVSDRRASLDEETEIKPALRKLVEDEFRRGASIPVVPFPGEARADPEPVVAVLQRSLPDALAPYLVLRDRLLAILGIGVALSALGRAASFARRSSSHLLGSASLARSRKGRWVATSIGTIAWHFSRRSGMQRKRPRTRYGVTTASPSWRTRRSRTGSR